MKKNAATLTAICDRIAGGCLSQAEAARRCDVSVASYWSWIKSSQENPAAWQITFLDSPMAFHECVALARKIGLQDVLGRFEMRCGGGPDGGTREKVFFQGRPCWKELEAAVDLDPDVRELMGYPRDGLERDANGNRIQLEIIHAPAVAAVVKLLESNFTQYKQRSELNVNQKTQLGVTVVDQRKPKAPPPQVEIVQPRVIAAPADDDLSDLLGEEITEGVFEEIEEAPAAPPMAASQPAPTPEPKIVDERFGSLTNEQAALLRQLRKNVPLNATLQPRTLIQTFSAVDRDDNDPARVGAGTIPANGMKLR
jgi:hypothetical protein